MEDITDPIQVVNPKHGDLDGQVRSAVGKLFRLQAKFGAMTLESTDCQQTTPFINKKAALLEDIEIRKKAVDELKVQRKETFKLRS